MTPTSKRANPQRRFDSSVVFTFMPFHAWRRDQPFLHSSARSPPVLKQHADQHRPERPVLLAVDQQFSEGPALRIAPKTRRSCRTARSRGA
jgi:hypothetical protein